MNLKNLNIDELEKLKKESSINIEVGEENIKKNNFEKTGVKGEGLAFTYYDLKSGNEIGHRVRLKKPLYDEETNKSIRYMSKKGNDCSCFFPKDQIEKINDVNTPIAICEGEKKALAMASSRVFDNYAIISYPGVFNWKKKNTDGQLSTQWDLIPFADRDVYLFPDSGLFTNRHEYQGVKDFIQAIYKKGANIKAYDLSNPADRFAKIGIDDYIVNFGEENLNNLIKKPFWEFIQTYPENFSEKNREAFLKSFVLMTESEIYRCLDKIKEVQQTRFIKSTAIKSIREYQRAWKNIEPKKVPAADELIWEPFSQSINDLMNLLQLKIQTVPRLFRNSSSNSFIYINEHGQHFIISSVNKAVAFFANFFNLRRKTVNEGEEHIGPNEHIPDRIMATFMELDSNFEKMKQVNLVTTIPQFFKGNLICEYGYNDDSKIFYSGSPIYSTNSLKHTNKLINSFPFSTQDDCINLLGLLISFFLIEEFKGQHPAVIIQGDMQNLGKTTLAEVLSIIFQNKLPKSISLTGEEELKKTISAVVQENGVVLIDNIKSHGSLGKIVSSPSLEAMITSEKIQFRVLGENRLFERENNVLFIFTLNSGSFSPDLATRSIYLNLSKDSQTRINPEFDPKSYAEKYRDEILSELLYLIENYMKTTGLDSKSSSFPIFKFKKWATVVEKILIANNKLGFLSNQNKIQESRNPVLDEIKDFLLMSYAAQPKRVIFEIEPFHLVKEINNECFGDTTSLTGKSMKISNVLTPLDEIVIDHLVFKIRKKQSKVGGRSKSFEFTIFDQPELRNLYHN